MSHEPGIVYKLHDGDSPLGLMGLMLKAANPSINRGKMSCRVRISRETPDRSRDVVRAKGALLDNHKKNPVVCVAHNRQVVCGMAEDGLSNYTVKMAPDGSGWDAETFFDQRSEIGEQSFRLVESKVFRGASIGFMPIEGYMSKSDYGGVDYKRWELVEYSHLPIPDHPDCLVEAVHKGFGGKALCPELLGILKPLMSDGPVVVTSGWDTNGVNKSGTFKTAEPKETTARTRASVYYTCPHCNQEMTQEHIYKDEESDCYRHGNCRGAVILKPEPHVVEAGQTEPAGLAPGSGTKSARFLPGLRNKNMRHPPADGYEDMENDDYSEFQPPDESEYDDDEDADAGASMKPGNELFHRVHDCLMQALQEIDDGTGMVDNAHATKTAEKVAATLMKAVKELTKGHGKYLEEHPDQEPLPGANYDGDDGDSAEEEEDDPDEHEDFSDLESDEEDEPEDTEGDGKTGKKKKGKPFGGKEEKAIRDERMALCNRYWEALKVKGVTADGPTLQAARDDLYAIAADKTVPRAQRIRANERRKLLEQVIVTKGTPATTGTNGEHDLDTIFNGFTMEDLDRCLVEQPGA